jgi:hypothetical protein
MRIVFCYMLLTSQHISRASDIQQADSLWYPISVAQLFEVVPDPGWLEWVRFVAFFSTILLGLGIFTRAVGPVVFVSHLIFNSVVMSFGKLGHDTQAYLLILFVMLFSDWGHTFSLDSAWRRWRHLPAKGHPTSWPDWPLWLSTMMLALLYLSSGFFKISKGYFLAPGTFEQFLHYRLRLWENAPGWVQPIIAFITTDYPGFSTALAYGSALFEAGFIIGLLSPRFRLLVLSGAWVFHGSIFFLSGVSFDSPIQLSALIFLPTLILLLRERWPWLERIFPTEPETSDKGDGWAGWPVWLRVVIYLGITFVIMITSHGLVSFSWFDLNPLIKSLPKLDAGRFHYLTTMLGLVSVISVSIWLTTDAAKKILARRRGIIDQPITR